MILLLCLSAAYDGPLLDAHTHISPPGRGQGQPQSRRQPAVYEADDLVAWLRDGGVDGVILIGPERITSGAAREYPDFVYPAVEPGRNSGDRFLTRTDDALAEVERQLETGVRIIGEVSVRHNQPPNIPDNSIPADDPWLLRMYDLAGEHGVPVNIHVEARYEDELVNALEQSRDTTLIWAHAGDADAETVARLMRRHPNLHADVSCRHPYFERGFDLDEQSLCDGDGRIQRGWRELFEEFPERFLFGLDLGTNNRHEQVDELVAFYRNMLGQLTPETAEAIGHLNARRLLRLDE